MPSFVQIVANGTGTGINPLVLTLGAAISTSPGNMLSAQVKMTSARTLTSVTDSQGNTWHVDIQLSSTTSGCATASAMIVTPLTTGDTITFNFSGTCTPAIGVAEFSGVGSSGGLSQLDQTADLVNAAGLTVSPEMASAMTGAGELLVTAFGSSAAAATCSVTAADPDTAGTWTLIAYGQGGVGGAWQIGPGSLTKSKVTWTATAGSSCEGQIASYLAASTAKSGTETSGGAEGAAKTGVNDAAGFP